MTKGKYGIAGVASIFVISRMPNYSLNILADSIIIMYSLTF